MKGSPNSSTKPDMLKAFITSLATNKKNSETYITEQLKVYFREQTSWLVQTIFQKFSSRQRKRQRGSRSRSRERDQNRRRLHSP